MRQIFKPLWLVVLFAASLASVANGQDFTNKDTLRYVDAMHYRLINWAFDRTLKSRIPLEFYGNVRPTLWDRATCTSGKASALPPTRQPSPCVITC